MIMCLKLLGNKQKEIFRIGLFRFSERYVLGLVPLLVKTQGSKGEGGSLSCPFGGSIKLMSVTLLSLSF